LGAQPGNLGSSSSSMLFWPCNLDLACKGVIFEMII
jgi:hypothetical protein